jgi:hypothetical protein
MKGSRRRPGKVPPDEHGRAHPGVLGEGGVPVDPYLQWAVATNYVYLPGHPGQDLPILIKLKGGLTAQAFASKNWGDVRPPADLDEWFTIPQIYRKLPAGLAPLEYCTAEVRRESVSRLFAAPFTSVIERFELSDPVGHTMAPIVAAGQAAGAWTPKVIVGVIDDGLPFANVRFRDTITSTRVEFLWDQDRATDLSKATIDTFLAQCQHAGLVDEDEVYRLAGYDYRVSGHKSWARRATHGAHVMDWACGLDLSKVAADSPRIIGVQLPSQVTANPQGGMLGAYAFVALLYILNRADQVAASYGSGPLPVVVNLSYGVNHGPHDGTSLLERAIDTVTVLRRLVKPLTMVLAAGNSHLTRCHAHFKLDPVVTPSHTLEWRVLPDDATTSHLEIWLPYDAGTKQVEVEVETPDHTHLGPVQEGDPLLLWPSPMTPLLAVWYPGAPAFGARNVISLSLAPTTSLGSNTPVAPSGPWRIKVTNVGGTALWLDSWILRDDTPFGYPIRGRQSRFEDPLYERFDSQGRPSEVDLLASYVKRDSSINGIATGRETVVIGGCRRSDLVSARYSAGGPTLKPSAIQPAPRLGPDATAVAEWSVACRGMLASGTRSRSIVSVNGTSVSAPQVTRFIAGTMALGNAGDRTEVATEGANNPTPKIPAKRGNYGYVDPQYAPIKVER